MTLGHQIKIPFTLLALRPWLALQSCLTLQEFKEGFICWDYFFVLTSGPALRGHEKQTATQRFPAGNWGMERPRNKLCLQQLPIPSKERRKGTVCWGCSLPAAQENSCWSLPPAPLAPSPGWGTRRWEYQLQRKGERDALSFAYATCFSISFCSFLSQSHHLFPPAASVPSSPEVWSSSGFLYSLDDAILDHFFLK